MSNILAEDSHSEWSVLTQQKQFTCLTIITVMVGVVFNDVDPFIPQVSLIGILQNPFFSALHQVFDEVLRWLCNNR